MIFIIPDSVMDETLKNPPKTKVYDIFVKK
ncbi:hypothetical protein QE441_000662 [Chryseobacterium sp. SORGH_AS909]|uniref:Uncharacterized protein n=1 Tax=Chryseobacterium camelliae TaxID=1265445 RepID=A0ABU0TKC4_9FLAO|nr:hypothetical protein [Chryseobacterium camelliae]MDQ1101424.1 hypothetical protein [Chryseobacterium sp. SORGH_AS_1048]MDR6084868.1 hypothetical protein [Chryseobacterium sp. SORGH_AS_0909]MDR6129219.1 hypothetical protein [Chryseobacterium sp. SORGH_AS_1175]MDT3408650.1 hypothetical protein [Pseudacidovorax intermedius]